MKPGYLTEIKERAEKATGGKWQAAPDTLAGRVWVTSTLGLIAEPLHSLKNLFAMRGADWDIKDKRWEQKVADAEFIANARQDIPCLVAALEEAIGQVELFKECMNRPDEFREQAAKKAVDNLWVSAEESDGVEDNGSINISREGVQEIISQSLRAYRDGLSQIVLKGPTT